MDLKNADFVACLALYQSRKDTAIGLSHITTKQKGLIWYYNTLKQDIAIKSFYLGYVQRASERIKEIVQSVTINTSEKNANLLYQEAIYLEKQIREIKEKWLI